MKKRRNKIASENPTRGFIGMALVIVVIIFAFFLAGGLKIKTKSTSSQNTLVSSYTCCDTGDGSECKVSDTKRFTWRGDEYGLIKSGIALSEKSQHLAPASPPDDKTTEGERIFLNISDTTAPGYGNIPGCENGKDLVFGPSGCAGILNDEIIYVCKSDCQGNTGTGQFDAYFRVKDGDIPDVIKNCTKPEGGKTGSSQELVIVSETGKTNLQLQTFKVIEKNIPASWLSPYCKPAVYLYPEKPTEILVKVNSSNPLTYTDPLYPEGGWKTIGNPDGIIEYLNKDYDYLYYETTVLDKDVAKPSEGFVVKQEELSNLFSNLLPSLGLNGKETKQFSDYWLNKLPTSSYYFVGIVPRSDLEKSTSLDINPKPQTVIRVALYFETLNEKVNVPAPKITTPGRSGFTVSEWGGIFKRHPGQNFSCFE